VSYICFFYPARAPRTRSLQCGDNSHFEPKSRTQNREIGFVSNLHGQLSADCAGEHVLGQIGKPSRRLVARLSQAVELDSELVPQGMGMSRVSKK
jgi:hypothetical protein